MTMKAGLAGPPANPADILQPAPEKSPFWHALRMKIGNNQPGDTIRQAQPPSAHREEI
jgi:hypothetical protein